MRVLRVMCCVLALAVCLTPAARADEWNKLTYLTFSGPVEIPGKTLPAGTYMFKLADSPSNRHIVQIFDKDGTKIYATLLAIPNERLEPSDKPVVMFSERPAGTPAAVKAWFYPGNTIGDEFIYPRRQALEIARATNQSVLSTSTETTDEKEMRSAEVARVEPPAPSATSTTGTTTTTTAEEQKKTMPPPTTTAEQQPTTTQAPPAESARPARHLPRTASPLALYELLSGLAFAGAYGVRRLRK